MADKITLGQVVSEVRSNLDDDQYDRTVIVAKTNDFQNEVLTSHRIRFMEASEDLSVAAGDTEVVFPANFLTALHVIIFDTATQYRDITNNYVPYEQFMRSSPNFRIARAGKIMTWTDFGNGMRLAQPADLDYAMLLDFLRAPEQVTSDSDELDIPITYKEMVVKGTFSRVVEREEDYNIGDQERSLLQDLVTTFVRNEGRGQMKTGPNIIGTRRRQVREW